MLKKRRHDADRQTKWNRFSRTSTAKDPLSSDPGCSTVPLSNAVNITVNQRQRRIDVFLLPSSFGFSLWVLSCRFFIPCSISTFFSFKPKVHKPKSCLFFVCLFPLIPFSILFWPIIFAWPLRHCTILFWVGLTWFYSAPVAPISSTLFFGSCSWLCAFCGCCSKSVGLFGPASSLLSVYLCCFSCFCCCFGLTLFDLNTERKASPSWNGEEHYPLLSTTNFLTRS